LINGNAALINKPKTNCLYISPACRVFLLV
jgi:hypothetical protein